jgi:uncharacterized protein YjdB
MNVFATSALTVQDINNVTDGYGARININFGTSLSNNSSYWAAISTNNIEMKDKNGTAITVESAETCGTSIVINRAKTRVAEVGDRLTLKSGFQIIASDNSFTYPETISADITYEYATAGSPWILYVAQRETLTVQDVNYISNYAGGYGACFAVNFGVTCGLADFTRITDYSKVSLIDKNGTAVEITYLEAQGNYLIFQRSQTRIAEIGDKLTLKQGLIFGGKEIKEDITYEYDIAGSPWIEYHEITELKIVENAQATYGFDINLLNDTTWTAPCVQVNFVTSNTFNLYQAAYSKDKIVYTNAFGENVNIIDCINVNNTYFIMRLGESLENPYYAMKGDKITFKQGFALVKYEEILIDTTFIVPSTSNTSLKLYAESDNPAEFEITNSNADKDLAIDATVQLNYSLPQGKLATPYFTSSNSEIATVTKAGLVTGVDVGEVTITAHIGEIIRNFVMTIKEAQAITSVEFINSYIVWVVKGEELIFPNFKAHAIFADGSNGADFDLVAGENFTLPTCDTSTAGEKTLETKILYKDNEYTVNLYVNVYEIGDVKISEIGIVAWFNYVVFVQYPNSSMNVANITNTSNIDGVLNNIEYKRADGTLVEIKGFYMLGGGNLALLMFDDLTEANFNQYYLVGDILTLKAGMKIWMWTGETEVTETDDHAVKAGTGMYIVEGILSEDIVYKYSGNVWGVYVEYTDITVKNSTIDLQIGKKVDSGVSRLPSNATTGTISYASSDETIATISAKGSITGIKAGTATITITIDGGLAGIKTQTITVTVSDYIDGIVFEPSSISSKKSSTLDLSNVSAKLHYASGNTSDNIDLTNAIISGFDATVIGEQTVIISVIVDNVTYTGTLIVVVKTGCGSSISIQLITIPTILCCLVFIGILALRKKKVK